VAALVQRIARPAAALCPQSPDELDSARPAGRWYVLPLSARGDSALRAQAARLAAHLEQRPGLRLDAVAHTLLTGRARFARRAAVLARGRTEALLALRALAGDGSMADGPGWALVQAVGTGSQVDGIVAATEAITDGTCASNRLADSKMVAHRKIAASQSAPNSVAFER